MQPSGYYIFTIADSIWAKVQERKIGRERQPFWSPWLILFLIVWTGGWYVSVDNPQALFMNNWWFILLGIAGAFLGNISAVGGGLVFIPVAVFLLHLAPVTALKLSLGTQALGMTSGAIRWLQMRNIPRRALRIAVPGLLIGSTISSFVIHPSALLVKAFFGPVSVLVGAITILFVIINRSAQSRDDIPNDTRWPLLITSIIGGIITGWIAIGEGELVAALLVLRYNVNASVSIAFGVVLLSINSIYLAIVHTIFLGGLPWKYIIFTGAGAVIGARIAPWFTNIWNNNVFKIVFAIIAIADGSLFILQFVLSRKL